MKKLKVLALALICAAFSPEKPTKECGFFS